MRYEFHVGDYVETVDGKVGYITKVDCLYIPYGEDEKEERKSKFGRSRWSWSGIHR